MINFKRIPKERFTGEWIDFILFNWFGGINEILYICARTTIFIRIL